MTIWDQGNPCKLLVSLAFPRCPWHELGPAIDILVQSRVCGASRQREHLPAAAAGTEAGGHTDFPGLLRITHAEGEGAGGVAGGGGYEGRYGEPLGVSVGIRRRGMGERR